VERAAGSGDAAREPREALTANEIRTSIIGSRNLRQSEERIHKSAKLWIEQLQFAVKSEISATAFASRSPDDVAARGPSGHAPPSEYDPFLDSVAVVRTRNEAQGTQIATLLTRLDALESQLAGETMGTD
jgi:hypothetical protein